MKQIYQRAECFSANDGSQRFEIQWLEIDVAAERRRETKTRIVSVLIGLFALAIGVAALVVSLRCA